jgi:hypothetical protein
MNTIFGSRNGSGSIGCTGEGEHGVLLTQIMHLTGRVARPYNICVGANSMFAPRSEDTFHQDHA